MKFMLMMTNLFSVFKPSTSNSVALNWMSMMIFISMIWLKFWLIPSRMYMVNNLILFFIFEAFKGVVQYSFSNIMLFYATIMFILFTNCMGLFLYSFAALSHLSLSLFLSLSLWISITTYGLINFFNEMMPYLTLSDTPSVLMPFMVIIKSFSLVIIRPFTLAIWLAANMIAGHLLLTLMGSTGQEIFVLIIMNKYYNYKADFIIYSWNLCINYSSLCIFNSLCSLLKSIMW